MPDTFELAKWKVDHNALLLELIEQRRALGERVYREAQNKFQVRLSGTITLGGKPDLVTVAPDGSVRIFDAKTGSPKTSDQVQMMLYLFCLPSAFPKYKGQQIDGCVVYASGVRAPVPCEAVTPDFKTQARQFINLLDSDVVPDRAPSPDECRYCDITPADWLSAFAPDSVAFAEYPGVGANGVVHHEHLLLRAGGVPVVHRQRAYELVRDLYTLPRLRSP